MPENLFVAELPYYYRPAQLALINKTGSGKIVRLWRASIGELNGGTSGDYVAELRSITASSGGDAVVPVAFDSTAPALPSQVTAVAGPTSTTGTTVLRRVFGSLSHLEITALSGLARSLSAAKWQPHSDAQRFTLREGQGIALVPVSPGRAANRSLRVQVKVGSHVYTYHSLLRRDTMADFAIVNGAGSGVVVELLSVELDVLSGYGINVSAYALERICGLNETQGSAVPPLSHDTTNSASAAVVCMANAVCLLDGAKSGAWLARTAMRNAARMHYGHSVGLGKNFQNNTGAIPDIFRAHHLDTSLVLREGEGVGLFQRNTDGIFTPQLSMIWTVESVGGGGVTTVARGFA